MKNTLKKITFSIIVTCILTFFLPSCAIQKGTLQNSSSLSSNNFTYVKRNVKGSAKSVLVFGIGGFLKESLVNEAKINMLQDNQLQNNQALVNITVSEKQSIYVFIIVQSITITADIVEFK